MKQILRPNGGKFAYGYSESGNVTAITQSTEDGEENSTNTHYTCGEVTKLASGNNKVQYAYDYKRRLVKVDLNGVANYVTYSYGDKISATVNGTSQTVNKVTATYVKRNSSLAADVFETLSDLNGNVLQTKYNGTVQAESVYSADNKLTAYSDKIKNRSISYSYGELDRVTTYAEKSGGTEQTIFCRGNLSPRPSLRPPAKRYFVPTSRGARSRHSRSNPEVTGICRLVI